MKSSNFLVFLQLSYDIETFFDMFQAFEHIWVIFQMNSRCGFWIIQLEPSGDPPTLGSLGIPGSRWFTFAASRSLWARVIDLFRHFCHYTWPHGPIWVMPCAIRELWECICDDRWAWCKWIDWTRLDPPKLLPVAFVAKIICTPWSKTTITACFLALGPRMQPTCKKTHKLGCR